MKLMRRIVIFVLLTALVGVTTLPTVASAQTDALDGVKAAYLTDADGTVSMYEQDADRRLPIASMVKIMTALLTVEAIQRGELAIDEKVRISPTAMGMGGSQMFLNAGDDYPVSDLLKGVIVVSANDACVALAERLSGSQEEFVMRMNSRAALLGMTNTHFANCTGLPHPEGYSCARDVSKMLAELTRSPLYHDYSTIWLEDYTHPDGRVTTLTNTNKLIRFYDGCDGGKTGFTQEAGFCLAATAYKNGLRLISVVIGGRDSKTRFATSSQLLNKGFAGYRRNVLAKANDYDELVSVRGGKNDCVWATVAQSLGVVCAVGEQPNAYVEYVSYDRKAPIAVGDEVGVAHLVVDGVVTHSEPLLALEEMPKATWGDAIQDFLGHYPLRQN